MGTQGNTTSNTTAWPPPKILWTILVVMRDCAELVRPHDRVKFPPCMQTNPVIGTLAWRLLHKHGPSQCFFVLVAAKVPYLAGLTSGFLVITPLTCL